MQHGVREDNSNYLVRGSRAPAEAPVDNQLPSAFQQLLVQLCLLALLAYLLHAARGAGPSCGWQLESPDHRLVNGNGSNATMTVLAPNKSDVGTLIADAVSAVGAAVQKMESGAVAKLEQQSNGTWFANRSTWFGNGSSWFGNGSSWFGSSSSISSDGFVFYMK